MPFFRNLTDEADMPTAPATRFGQRVYEPNFLPVTKNIPTVFNKIRIWSGIS